MNIARRFLVVAVLLAGGLFATAPAQADHRHDHYSGGYGRYSGRYDRYSGGYGGYSGGYYQSGPVYHPPSVHYDRVYHPEYSHWTPRRGWHTHGHYDYVPHYVPGHYDYQHGDHIHPNPYYHHR